MYCIEIILTSVFISENNITKVMYERGVRFLLLYSYKKKKRIKDTLSHLSDSVTDKEFYIIHLPYKTRIVSIEVFGFVNGLVNRSD